jgi:hypothetical protein
MESDYVTLKSSASSRSSKQASLTQEVVRALTNTSKLLPQQDRDKVVEDVFSRLKKSQYSWYHVYTITLAGLKGYEGWRLRVRLEVRGLHPNRAQMSQRRDIRVILSRQDGFNREIYDCKALLDKAHDEKEPQHCTRCGPWGQEKRPVTTSL